MEKLDLEKTVDLETARNRRKILLQAMSELEERSVHCKDCTGLCCTFVANSVQTTPLETLEILLYLKRENRLNDTLKQRLTATVARYRLDSEIPGNGARSFVRRTYTCPFFGDPQGGCSLSRSVKPYGCLGFNPSQTRVVEGEQCGSNIPLLEKREAAFAEDEQTRNHHIRSFYKLDWEKKPMPAGLLELMALL